MPECVVGHICETPDLLPGQVQYLLHGYVAPGDQGILLRLFDIAPDIFPEASVELLVGIVQR